jgi:hypothetical protein
MALNINFFLIHGSAMWLAWGVFSVVQIASNRYMKGSHWDSRMWIHRLSAGIMVAITLFYALYAFGYLGWKVLDNAHSYFVFPILALVLIVAALGVVTRSMLRRNKWSTQMALTMKRVHWFFAYLIIILGIGAVVSGIHFYRINPAHASDIKLEWIHLTLYVLILVTLEVLYRKSLSPQVQFELAPNYKQKVIIPLKEFE